MDCEKFDRVVLDLLYDELDELTAAAAQRHMDHCARCGPIGNGLRATREVGVLPVVEPPPRLAQRILDAERAAQAGLAFRQRVGRAISVLAGYAMRPQLAMAAVLVLMVGMSLMLIPPRPGTRDSVRVTERGVPEMDTEELAETPMAEPRSDRDLGQAHGPLREERRSQTKSAPNTAEREAKAESSTDPYEKAMVDFRAGRYAQARTAFEHIAQGGGAKGPQADLMAARAARYAEGCDTSVTLLENVAAKYPGTDVANDANWFAGNCYRTMGQYASASQKYNALLDQPAYSDRARNALAGLPRPVAARAASRLAEDKPAAAPKAKKAAKAAAEASEAAPAAPVPTPAAPKSDRGY